jgi:O-phospho-L-seryl-tRNASec:L-selenocysteinyl-tRNA synthase
MNSSVAGDVAQALTGLRVPRTHVTAGLSNLIASHNQYRSLVVNRRLPDAGWSDVQIQHFLYTLSTLDTNSKRTAAASGGGDGEGETRWCGVGEREGRLYSSLVAQRHFGFGHGVGRSGDVAEPQPKAVGSTVLARLALLLALDAVRRGAGLDAKTAAAHGIVLPLCTGMSTSLVLGSLRDSHPEKNIVLWSRIDQKSCLKAVLTAGLQCVVVPTRLSGDEVATDLTAMEELLEEHGERVLAVVTTTSCFAPRVPDKVDDVARLCARRNVHHLINNAYGLQCSKTSKLINRACAVGRVDAVVGSTDKNFLVPVGGALVLSPSEGIVQGIGRIYAGRASASPVTDLFITLLSMGLNGYKRLLEKRSAMVETFPQRFQEVAQRHGERLLRCPSNTISFGITLDSLARPRQEGEEEQEYLESVSKEISQLGAMLFSRCVSGTRVIPRGSVKMMGGQEFCGFGSSVDNYPHAYMTAACAIGLSEGEVDEFFARLDKVFKEFKKRQQKSSG